MNHTQPFSEINSHFKKLGKSQKDFIAWTLRQYFADPGVPWYSEDVREDNVLAFLSQPNNKFPHTPISLVNLYRLKRSLQKSSGMVSNEELDEIIELQEKRKRQHRYHKGDADLKEVSSCIGDYTKSMISKISYEAIGKLKNLTNGKNLSSLSYEEEEELERRLNGALEKASTLYSEVLHLSQNHKQVISALRELKLLKASEVGQIKEEELRWIDEYVGLDASFLKEFLLIDIEQDDNFVQSFQMVYSKIVHGRKRGHYE